MTAIERNGNCEKSNMVTIKNDSNHEGEKGQRSEKKFVPRNSLLIDMYKISHIRTTYNIFLVMLLISFFKSVAQDYVETGVIYLGTKTIQTGFGNFYEIVQVWTLTVAFTFITYFGFSLWASKHMKITPNGIAMKMFNMSFLIGFVLYQIVYIAIPARLVMQKKLPTAACTLILMEQLRMLMKMVAFVRSNIPRVLTYRRSDNDSILKSNHPEFSKYLYFLFAPTLLYRDEYPRTDKIRWKIVFWNFAEVIMIVFCLSFLFEHYVIPWFDRHSFEIFKLQNAVHFTISMALPGTALLLFEFYSVLHSSQNCMAELLRFADRQFYKDWWNCTSHGEFHKAWNPMVHDWLYTYVYKDVYALSNSRYLAKFATFLISAIFHEYIITIALGFFYPVLLTIFIGVGTPFAIFAGNNSKLNNAVFFWLTVFLGQAVLLGLYSMEYYASLKCPPYSDQLLDMLLPRSWICHKAMSKAAQIKS